MTTQSKYQATAHRILNLEDFDVDMVYFSNIANHLSLEDLRREAHECGTTFCIAGRLAHIDGFPEAYWCEDHFDFTHYSSDICGYDFFSTEWDFLFAPWWPDDLDAAKERAAYVLEHGSAPPRDDWYDHWGYR